ncbi:LysR family transcriptional regulator [Neisseriaceae bacterium TC5R-5]|nr:LysR family transcriptional regulator [Neisseriaceae bacterium TC5R-5]
MPIDDDITLKKLSVFLTFMQQGSMARTAEHLGQSTVSVHRALHSLEQALGCALFKREGRLLTPLATARHFADSAAQALTLLENGIQQMRELAGFAGTQLKVGALYSLTAGVIPQILMGLKIRRPSIEVDLTLASNHALLQGLHEGRLDAIIIASAQADYPGALSVAMFEDEICFAAPLASPYQHHTEIDLATVSQLPFVALDEAFATGQDFNRAFHQLGLHAEVVMRVNDIFSLANLISGGMGYALLPKRVALFNPQIQLIPLAAHCKTYQHIRLLLNKSRERDPNLLALAAECRMQGKQRRQDRVAN